VGAVCALSVFLNFWSAFGYFCVLNRDVFVALVDWSFVDNFQCVFHWFLDIILRNPKNQRKFGIFSKI
jgi:hypothetical protein